MTEEKHIKNADEAVKILLDLMNTPQMVSIHFEFDCGADILPMVVYTIKRFAVGEDEA